MRRLLSLPLLAMALVAEPAVAATPTCVGSAPHFVREDKAVAVAIHCWDVEEDDIRIDLGTVANGTATLSDRGDGTGVIVYLPAEPGPGSSPSPAPSCPGT